MLQNDKWVRITLWLPVRPVNLVVVFKRGVFTLNNYIGQLSKKFMKSEELKKPLIPVGGGGLISAPRFTPKLIHAF